MIYKLKNPIKNFSWGSRTALNELFGIPNPNGLPQAELWMGSHPSASSVIEWNNRDVTLEAAILADSEYWLGKDGKFTSLPFLAKFLAANEPLSIQVHPSRQAAASGFNRENQAKIPLDASERNYKDNNHKPELVYAITPYLAMNGFRDFEQIVSNFELINLSSIRGDFESFRQTPNSETLSLFFASILCMQGDKKSVAIEELLAVIKEQFCSGELNEALELVEQLKVLYPDDVGLFAPLFLNVIELQPGQAMFLHAETPHAYIYGVGIEVMANSDNVLRAGLTSKHINVDELIKNTNFTPISFDKLLTKPVSTESGQAYSIPVDDFKFSLLSSEDEVRIAPTSVEILISLSDNVIVSTPSQTLALGKGESAVVPASTSIYQVSGKGELARVYC